MYNILSYQRCEARRTYRELELESRVPYNIDSGTVVVDITAPEDISAKQKCTNTPKRPSQTKAIVHSYIMLHINA